MFGRFRSILTALAYEPVNFSPPEGTLTLDGCMEGIDIALGARGPSLLMWGAKDVASTTMTRYLFPFYDDSTAMTTAVSFPMPVAGTIDRLIVRHNLPGGNGNDVVYTLRVNGAPSALAVTLASTATQGSDLVNSIPVVVGDLIDLEITKAATVGMSPADVAATVRLAA